VIVKVGDLTFGWGAEVRDLPENSESYGSRLLSAEEEGALAAAIKEAGWKPSWKAQPTERVVFLTGVTPDGARWRSRIVTQATRGQYMQVVEA
jgi:hypothetical protein